MSRQLSPSGHIPLNQATLDEMPDNEREFWQNFLEQMDEAWIAAQESDELCPFELSPELQELFKTAVLEHKGDRYCQVFHLRKWFKVEVPVVPVVEEHVLH